MEKKYYVYGLFDENDICFYIGKGTDKRYKHHRKNYKLGKITNYFLYCKLKSIFNKNSDFTEKILVDSLTEKEALEKELELINLYGKRIEEKGTLCNLLNGGNQPLSVEEIKKIYGEDFYKDMRKKQTESTKKTLYLKNKEKIEHIQKKLNENVLIKDIASEINLDRNTISKWIKKYNLNYNNHYKKQLEIERLKSFREKNSQKIQKTAYSYIVVTPENEKIKVNKLVVFCRERNIDYRGLRNTFNKKRKNGMPYKIKGYYIEEQKININTL
jgi:YesN/AraC family two-component response regulator